MEPDDNDGEFGAAGSRGLRERTDIAQDGLVKTGILCFAPVVRHKSRLLMTRRIRLVSGIAATAAFAACATANDLEGKAPVIEYTTSKPVQAVAGCIVEHWSNRTPYIASQRRGTGGVVMILHPQGGADAAAFLTHTAETTQLRYVEREGSLNRPWVRDAVLGCK